MTARIEDVAWHRSLLFSIAYRMLGGVADAEDIVQEQGCRCAVPDLRPRGSGEILAESTAYSPARVLRASHPSQRGPGVVGYVDGYPTSVVALDVADGYVQGIRIVVNPDKLRTIPPSPTSQQM
jgi:hypothetical protein